MISYRTLKLNCKHCFQLCLKDRDLVAGVEFEHEAVMKLISERCNRLLIIVSPNFLKSSANKFFLNYTQALSIGKFILLCNFYISATEMIF